MGRLLKKQPEKRLIKELKFVKEQLENSKEKVVAK